jgi:hypothetical protein
MMARRSLGRRSSMPISHETAKSPRLARHRRRLIATLSVALVLAAGAGVAASANYDTYYCGTASSTCTLGSGSPVSTASVALRDNNTVWCVSSCHTHVWYDQGSGAYDTTYTHGGQSISINQGSGGYAYSKCETDSGFGTNPAECDTTWHT